MRSGDKDANLATEVNNDVPIFRGTKNFQLEESAVEGMSIHRPRKIMCACELVARWLGEDDYPYPQDQMETWKLAAETFLETRRKRYNLVDHQSLLTRAFELYLRRHGHI